MCPNCKTLCCSGGPSVTRFPDKAVSRYKSAKIGWRERRIFNLEQLRRLPPTRRYYWSGIPPPSQEGVAIVCTKRTQQGDPFGTVACSFYCGRRRLPLLLVAVPGSLIRVYLIEASFFVDKLQNISFFLSLNQVPEKFGLTHIFF